MLVAIAPNKTDTKAIRSSLLDWGISFSMSMKKIPIAIAITNTEPMKLRIDELFIGIGFYTVINIPLKIIFFEFYAKYIYL